MFESYLKNPTRALVQGALIGSLSLLACSPATRPVSSPTEQPPIPTPVLATPEPTPSALERTCQLPSFPAGIEIRDQREGQNMRAALLGLHDISYRKAFGLFFQIKPAFFDALFRLGLPYGVKFKLGSWGSAQTTFEFDDMVNLRVTNAVAWNDQPEAPKVKTFSTASFHPQSCNSLTALYSDDFDWERIVWNGTAQTDKTQN